MDGGPATSQPAQASQKAGITTPSSSAESTPKLEMRNVSKTFPGVKALDKVEPEGLGRRGARPDGRERRRQIDADEDSVGRLSPIRAPRS